MKITKKQRASIAKSQNISDIIGDQLKESKKNTEKKVDLSKIATELSKRRQDVQEKED